MLKSLMLAAALLSTGPDGAWVPAWTASAAPARFDGTPQAPLAYEGETVRQDIRLGASARSIRLRVSNELGTEPVRIGRMRVGPADGEPLAVAFAGRTEAVLQPGDVLISDPVPLAVPAFGVISISTWLPERARGVVRRTAVRLAQGDAVVGDEVRPTRRQAFVSAVLVEREDEPVVIVALGDSITEGATATLGANLDWPSVLADRLEAACPGRFVVLNAGISGNQVVRHGRSPSVMMRLDRDVLSLPGADYVVLLEGINDIRHNGDPAQPGRDAEEVIAGYRQVLDRLEMHGVKVIGATLTPFAGSARFDARSEASRQALNAFIRQGDAFAAVIDFDAALRDPVRPEAIAAGLDRDDHLHPNDAGYRRMAEAIDLGLFGCGGR